MGFCFIQIDEALGAYLKDRRIRSISNERRSKMKVIRVFLLLVVFAMGFCGCARYQWRYTFPPGGTQIDFNRDIAYCNDYARTWCATNGTVVVSGTTSIH